MFEILSTNDHLSLPAPQAVLCLRLTSSYQSTIRSSPLKKQYLREAYPVLSLSPLPEMVSFLLAQYISLPTMLFSRTKPLSDHPFHHAQLSFISSNFRRSLRVFNRPSINRQGLVIVPIRKVVRAVKIECLLQRFSIIRRSLDPRPQAHSRVKH